MQVGTKKNLNGLPGLPAKNAVGGPGLKRRMKMRRRPMVISSDPQDYDPDDDGEEVDTTDDCLDAREQKELEYEFPKDLEP